MPAHPFLSRSLVSGVVEADTVDEARTKLDALLLKTGGKDSRTRASEFNFLFLDEVERTGSGVIAITMKDG